MSQARHHRTGFALFILHELGSIGRPLEFLRNLLIRPICAPSFQAFWRDWNPAYRFFLVVFIYRPIRRFLPRPLAVFLTFLACGLFLHDLPFLAGWQWFHGKFAMPAGTILFAIFGMFTVLSEGLRVDLSTWPTAVRAAANIGWLAGGFFMCRLLLNWLQ